VLELDRVFVQEEKYIENWRRWIVLEVESMQPKKMEVDSKEVEDSMVEEYKLPQ